MDGFHPLGYTKRRWSPSEYYDQGYDLDGFRTGVLEPLGPGGSRRCLNAKVDTLNDRLLPEKWTSIDDEDVVLVDGFMLARPDLVDHLDLLIWVEVDWETMVARAAERDVAWVGDRDKVIRRYREFWIPMHQYYEQRDRPLDSVDVAIRNEPFEAPTLYRPN